MQIEGYALRIGDTVIASDLHIGYEEALNAQGLLVPRSSFLSIRDRLLALLDKLRPRELVLNGDLKHEFGRISRTEWRETLRLIDILSEKVALIIVRGNHDKILDPLVGKRNITIKDYHIIGENYVCHGHAIPEDDDFKKAKRIVIGHEHPAIHLRENGRVERFKCFLKGRYGRKELIVMPSFNMMTEGTDVLSEKTLSPFIKDIRRFEVFVVDEKVYSFGKVGELIKRR